jgi:hypothetical protein
LRVIGRERKACSLLVIVLKATLSKAEKKTARQFFDKGLTLSIRRNERALRTIRNLRLRQKRYTQKIDILCRDIVGAHGEFIEKISILTFSHQFQEALLGLTDVSSILDAAIEFLRCHLQDTSSAVFMLEPKGFEIHFAGDSGNSLIEKKSFNNWFSPQLVNEISHSRQICTLEQLLVMGLQAPPKALKHITAAAIPLGQIGKTMGFVLFYRPAEAMYTPVELAKATAVMPALRIAVQRIQFGAEKPACGPVVSS